MRFSIRWKHVTSQGPKLDNSLGRTKLTSSREKQRLEHWTLTWSGRVTKKPCQICVPAGFKQIIFSHIFELGGITKHLRLAPRGNSEFCFPSTSMLSVEVPEETKLTVALHWKAFCIPLSKCGALSKVAPNCHGVERGRGTARGELEGILQYGSYVLPRFSEFSTSRAIKEIRCWDFKEGGSHFL